MNLENKNIMNFKISLFVIINTFIIFGCINKSKKNNVIAADKEVRQDTLVTDLSDEKQNNLSKKDYRKLTDLDVFKSFEIISGSLLYSDEDKSKTLTYLKNSDTHVLALARIVNPLSGKVLYSLLDTVYYHGKDHRVFTNLIECEKIDDANLKYVFAFSEYEDKEYLDKTLKAWSIDLKNDKFKLIDSKKVKCINIAFGYED